MCSKLSTQRKRWLTARAGVPMSGAGCVMANSHAAVGWMSRYLKVHAGPSAHQSASQNRLSSYRNARHFRTDERKRLSYDNAPTAYFQARTYCTRQVSRLLDGLV